MAKNNTNYIESKVFIIFFLAFFLSAHAFAFANLTLSGSSLTVYVGGNVSEQIRLGNWARPFYERLRGGISAPWMIGLLSGSFLCASLLLIRELLPFRTPLRSIALIGCFTLHPAVLSVFVSHLNHADAVFLSMLFSTAGTWFLIQKKYGWMFATLLWSIATSLSTDLWLFGPMLYLIVKRTNLCSLFETNNSCSKVSHKIVHHSILAFLFALALYSAGLFVMIRRYNIGFPIHPDPAALLPGILLLPLSYLLPYSAYVPINAILWIALALASLILAVRELILVQVWKQIGVCLFLLLLLSGINALFVNSGTLNLTQPLLAAFFLSLLSEGKTLPQQLRRCIAGVLTVLFLGQIVYANQMHLMKNLEFQSTVSLMTRVLDRVERTDGFIPGKTDVVLLGSPGDSQLAVPHKGFEHLSQFPGAQKHMAAFSESDDAPFIWQVMGYPLNLVSDAERSQLKANPEVQKMPSFPASGCIRWVNQKLVVKLSD